MWNYIDSSDPTLRNNFFGAVKLVQNPDIDKYKYSAYGLGLHMHGTFGFRAIGFCRNCKMFGADMRPSPHIDNKKKDILIYGKGAAQGLVGTTLTAEKTYSINFIEYNKKIRLSLHYNGANSYLFLNGTKTIKSKAKDSEIVATPLYLGNTSK